jgi:hypothetical protein
LSFNSLPLIPGTVSTGIIFAFTYMCIRYLCCIHLPTPFLATFPLPLGSTPHQQDRTGSVLLFFNFRRKNRKDKKRNMTFLLVGDKESYAGSFIVLFSCIEVLQP